MRVLVVILLLAVTAEAQTLAEAARKERARQAQLTSTKVFTSMDRGALAAPAGAATAAAAGTASTAPATTPASPAPPKPALAPVPPPVDPVQKWNNDMDKLRAKVRQLQDQEAALQLQVNQLTAQFTAPVIDENTKNQIQTRIGETQSKLNAVRTELDQSKKALDAMTLQGPPKKP